MRALGVICRNVDKCALIVSVQGFYTELVQDIMGFGGTYGGGVSGKGKKHVKSMNKTRFVISRVAYSESFVLRQGTVSFHKCCVACKNGADHFDI